MLPGQRSRVLRFFNSNVFFLHLVILISSHLHLFFFFSKLKNTKILNRRKNITEYFPVADDVPRKSIPLGILGQIIHLLEPFSPLLTSKYGQPYVAKVDFLSPTYECFLVAWKKCTIQYSQRAWFFKNGSRTAASESGIAFSLVNRERLRMKSSTLALQVPPFRWRKDPSCSIAKNPPWLCGPSSHLQRMKQELLFLFPRRQEGRKFSSIGKQFLRPRVRDMLVKQMFCIHFLPVRRFPGVTQSPCYKARTAFVIFCCTTLVYSVLLYRWCQGSSLSAQRLDSDQELLMSRGIALFPLLLMCLGEKIGSKRDKKNYCVVWYL